MGNNKKKNRSKGGAGAGTSARAPAAPAASLKPPPPAEDTIEGLLELCVILGVLSQAESDATAAAIASGSRSKADVARELAPCASAAVWPRFCAERAALLAEWAQNPDQPLRFKVGDSVEANVDDGPRPGSRCRATIVALWWRGDEATNNWPPAFVAPYQMRLDEGPHRGALIFAFEDKDDLIRAYPGGAVPSPVPTRPDPHELARAERSWHEDGYTAIHTAPFILSDDRELAVSVVRQLVRVANIAKHCPDEMCNSCRETPLHMAVMYPNIGIVMTLLAAGHDPRVENFRGKSATGMAEEAVEKAERGLGRGKAKAGPWESRAILALLRAWEEEAEKEEERLRAEARAAGGAGAGGKENAGGGAGEVFVRGRRVPKRGVSRYGQALHKAPPRGTVAAADMCLQQ